MALGTVVGSLDQAIDVLGECLGSGSLDVIRFKSLRDRLGRSKLPLAVLGPFKCGKSTFINAFLG